MLFSPMHLIFCPKKCYKSEDSAGKNWFTTETTRNYEIQFPNFYYSAFEDGWFCKTCVSFALSDRDKRSFINTSGGFGDYPSHKAALLGSTTHKQYILNKQAFNELRNNHSNVYKLLVNASLSNEIATTNQNRFVIKSFVQVIILW